MGAKLTLCPPSCSLAVFVVDTTEMELMISFGN
jgi:hypothetical protein